MSESRIGADYTDDADYRKSDTGGVGGNCLKQDLQDLSDFRDRKRSGIGVPSYTERSVG